jgi:hypothetical protein
MLTKQLIWGGLKSTKRGRYDYHSAIKNSKDTSTTSDDLRWVLVSNYRPFLPTRSTSRVIAENRFFNLFLFAVDGTAGTGRPSTAGRPPVRVRVRVRSTTISSPQQQGSEVWGLKNGPFLRTPQAKKEIQQQGSEVWGLKKGPLQAKKEIFGPGQIQATA